MVSSFASSAHRLGTRPQNVNTSLLAVSVIPLFACDRLIANNVKRPCATLSRSVNDGLKSEGMINGAR